MNTPSPTPDLDATLATLLELDMRVVHVVTNLLEAEQAAAEKLVGRLTGKAAAGRAGNKAVAAGKHLERAAAAMAAAGPRIELLADAFDRLSSSVRLGVALRRRLQSGWPHDSSADGFPASLLRPVGNSAVEKMRRAAEALDEEEEEDEDEDLSDELDQELNDPDLHDALTLPVDELVQRICRAIAEAAAACAPLLQPSSDPKLPVSRPDPAAADG